MFKFLKEKLKNAVSKFSKDIDEESETVEEVTEEHVKEIEKSEEGKGFLRKIKEKFTKKKEEHEEEKAEEVRKEKPKKKEKKKRAKKESEAKAEEREEKIAEPEVAEERKEEEKKVIEEAKEPEIAGEKEEKKKPEEKKAEEEKPEGKAEETEEKKPEVVEEGSKEVEDAEEKKVEISEEVREEKVSEEVKEPEEAKEEKKTFFEKVKERFVKKEKEEVKEEEKKEEVVEEKKEKLEGEKVEEIQEKPIEEFREEEKKTIFKRVSDAVTKKSISEKKFDEYFWNLEVVLLENNVAVEVVEKIKEDLKEKLVNTKVRIGKTEDIIISTLEKSIEELFNIEKIDLIKKIKEKRPFVMCFVGVNGSGKTTTIAKFVKMLQKNNLSCVIAAADTFRAAAIHQLEEHAQKLDVRLIKHDYGADPAAVAYDAVEHAKAKNIDVVLVDTAGRQHSNINLVDEMKKIIRVVSPDMKIFVGDSLTGNDAVEQSRKFNEAIGIDAIVLSKVDVDEKGGAALSISHVTGKPIIYIGTGQNYEDLSEFNKDVVVKSLGLMA